MASPRERLGTTALNVTDLVTQEIQSPAASRMLAQGFLIQVPAGASWIDQEIETELGVTEISRVASVPFLLSRMKNYPSEASRKFRNY